MDQMLDAGFWILDFRRKLSLFIQHQVSSIQYLANCGINDRFHDVVIFGSGLSGLCNSGMNYQSRCRTHLTNNLDRS